VLGVPPAVLFGVIAVGCCGLDTRTERARPNIILVMADDQGWGDTGFNGHAVLETPAMNRMAREGVRWDRFYAAAPVCSPTRASVLTGRHPYRMQIDGANSGHMPTEEFTLGEMCAELGYATGHFGKWHLGTLTREIVDSNRGGRANHDQHYSPPWQHGFERCFSTEAKVPTWDPMVNPETNAPYGTRYWDENGEVVTTNLEGDDSRIIVDRALPFISEAAEAKQPFLAVIWLHAPHRPVVAGPANELQYAATEREDLRRYYAVVSAIDEQLARLRQHLEALGIGDSTVLWYTSDNGPEGSDRDGQGSTAGLRGRKRSLYEGGVRVPGLLVWPDGVAMGRRLYSAASTLDMLPTLADVLGVQLDPERPIDGISLLPAMTGADPDERPGGAPLPFLSGKAAALHQGSLKAIRSSKEGEWELYDLARDPGESKNLATDRPEQLAELTSRFAQWMSRAEQDRQH